VSEMLFNVLKLSEQYTVSIHICILAYYVWEGVCKGEFINIEAKGLIFSYAV
jgi:hypothetical protein